jgi:DNA topoisomerase-1
MVGVLNDFYDPFQKALAVARKTAREEIIAVPQPENECTTEKCPHCGGDVVIRSGKHGKFKGCSNFPKCKWTSSLKSKTREDPSTGETCPECDGDVVVRRGKYGRFRACSNFPTCKWSAPLVVGTCPKCGGHLVERRGKTGVFWGCSNYPDCRYRQQPGEPQEKEKPTP